ncbi:TlpA family protein disulfide reductase [Neomegalonema perideroedes]|uniref:TlpA family protein disulfide reductase n=1 Tax=Neomegalonema perideroedes TaxID=217219 RepID=UPI00036A3B3B|nr:TlpA disulfide reductase family protein [Neomegalonema perideroedes]
MIGFISAKPFGFLALAATLLAGCGEDGAAPAAQSAASAPSTASAAATPAAAPAPALVVPAKWRGLDETARTELRALAAGPMARLIVHPETRPFWEKGFASETDAPMDLTDFRGRVTLLNFWATWCAPCRAEMPALDALQRELGGPDFHIAPLNIERGGAEKSRAFFAEIGVKDLPVYLDPRSTLAKEFAVLGLPVSVLLDREGREVARLTGDADWSSPEAQAVIRRLVAATAPAP